MRSKISYKIIAGVSSVAILIIAIFSYIILNSHRKQLIADVERSVHQLSETIKSSTRYDMLLNQRESVHQIIQTIGMQEGIEKVRIFNKYGEIIFSTDSLDFGKMVDQKAEACNACHAADKPLESVPVSQRTRIFQNETDTNIFGIINPIYNEQSCWLGSCHAHDSNQKVLGVLDITMSLQEVDEAFQDTEIRLISFTIIAITAFSIIILLLARKVVIKPVDKIVEATQKVANGNLEYSIELNHKDEIGKLAESFNEMTKKLADAQRQLFQSDKLASVGRLAAGVAHEINNPLTGVLAYSSHLLKHSNANPELKQDLEVIVNETIRCRDIVKVLLDFSRQPIPEKRRININDVVKNAIRILKNQFSNRKINLVLNLKEDLPQINADSGQIQQVLVNLLVNAGDAMPEQNGEIVLETELKSTQKSDESSKSNINSFIQLKVIDNGSGIPEENLTKIFDPFFSTKGKEGTGLGLAIVWSIIEKHNGKIFVASKINEGTTFTILLPTENTV